MDFKHYIDDSWARHDKQPDQIMQAYDEGLKLIQTEADVVAFARLIHHVATEHHFNFDVAVTIFEKIKNLALAQTPAVLQVLKRNIATFQFIKNKNLDLKDYSDSDRAMIYVITAASLVMQKHIENVEVFLDQAIEAAESLNKDDPANRILAMSNNNMAAELSEKSGLTDLEKRLLIRTSKYSRKFWELAGTWLQVERCEYDLSKYHRIIGDLDQALHHAKLCLQICELEKAEPLEFFFAHECFAMVFKARGNQAEFRSHLQQMKSFFTQCSEKDQAWMQKSLVAAEAQSG